MLFFRDNAFGRDNDQDFESQGLAERDNVENNTGAESGDADDEGNAKEKLLEDRNAEKTGKDGIRKGAKDSTKKEGVKGNTAKGKKMVKKPVKKPTESLEDKFKVPEIPKISTPPAVKYPKRGNQDMEQDTASAKDRKRHEIEELKAELRKAKNARVDMEKERESKVRQAKMLQNQMMQKRNQCRFLQLLKTFMSNLNVEVNVEV